MVSYLAVALICIVAGMAAKPGIVLACKIIFQPRRRK